MVISRWILSDEGVSKGKVHLCTGTEVLYRPYGPEGSRGIAPLFLDHGTRRGWGVSVTPRPLFTPRKDPVPTVQEAGWASGSVWRGAENLANTGIRSSDRPARSQSPYRLRLAAHLPNEGWRENQKTHCTFSTPLRKLCLLWDNEEKYGTARYFRQDNILWRRKDVICMPYNQGKNTDINS